MFDDNDYNYEKEKIEKNYRNMSKKEHDPIIEWCKTWDNNKCQIGGEDFADLERQADMKAEVTGKPRILPVYVAEHKDGDSSHTDGYIELPDGETTWHKYGNMRRTCWSCNRFKGARENNLVSGMNKMTQEKQDRLKKEGTFVKKVHMMIEKRGHVCYRSTIKASKNIVDCSEVTGQRYFDSEIKTVENPKGKFKLFPYDCKGKFCNGDHVGIVGIKPDILIEEERTALIEEWQIEYSLNPNYPEKEGIRQWESYWQNLGKKWMPLNEYVEAKLEKVWS